MNRWLTVVLGAAVILLAAAVTGISASAPRAATSLKEATVLVGEAGVTIPVGTLSAPLLDGGASSAANARSEPGSAPIPGGNGPDSLDDGGSPLSLALPAVPSLPDGAPQRVRIGVVLVTYEGADGAPPGTRSKAAAEALVTTLAGEAKADFHAAVAKGDSGSADDIGHMPRGVLAPEVEARVFSTAKGDVSSPIDTPRGFWIVKRID